MKNANMGRLGHLLRDWNNRFFTLSSPRNLVGDLPLCKRLTRTNNGFPTTTLGNDDHGNNRSRIKTLRDDDNNNGSPNPAGRRVSGSTAWVVSSGFTLIELLVVVLIIGILASVAVPQYKVAVGKARYQKIMMTLRPLKTALEAHYLANGEYPPDTLDGVDVEIAGCSPRGHDQQGCDGFSIDYNGGRPYASKGYDDIDVVEKNLNLRCIIHLEHSPKLPGKTVCAANSIYNPNYKLIKSLGGEQTTVAIHELSASDGWYIMP